MAFRFAFSFLPNLPALREAANALEAFLQEHRVDEKSIFILQTALEELATNAMKYACPPAQTPSLRWEIALPEASEESSSIKCRFTHSGQPFNPLETHPETSAPPASGGFGLKMLRGLFAEFSYAQAGDENQFSLTLPVSPPSP